MLIEADGILDDNVTAVFIVGDTTYAYDTRSNEPFIIPDGVTKIDNCFLNECENVTKAPRIPDSVTEIGSFFLSECTNLKEPPVLPLSITEIGSYFLSWCTCLTEPPHIPESVEFVGMDFLDVSLGLNKLFNKWYIDDKGPAFTNSRRYWRRKRGVRLNTLARILDIPCHIFLEYDYILFKIRSTIFPNSSSSSLKLLSLSIISTGTLIVPSREGISTCDRFRNLSCSSSRARWYSSLTLLSPSRLRSRTLLIHSSRVGLR